MAILVIDDSRLMRTVLRTALLDAGFEAQELEPTSLLDVLQHLRATRPDLVLTDYEMPACNGETLLRALREDPVLKDTRVVVVTAHRDEELLQRLSRWGLSGTLAKPLTPEAIVGAVREALA